MIGVLAELLGVLFPTVAEKFIVITIIPVVLAPIVCPMDTVWSAWGVM